LGIKFGYQIRPTPDVGCRPERLKPQLKPMPAAPADRSDTFQRICKSECLRWDIRFAALDGRVPLVLDLSP
jgi:hypothetical protein